MEGALSPPFPLYLRITPPKPVYNSKCGKQFLKFKASARSQHHPVHHSKKRASFAANYSTKKRWRPPPFLEKDAFPSSLPIHTKNPRAIYKDIQRFARNDKLEKALIIMDYVEQQGIPVNPTTFSALIAACIRSKSLTFAKQIHTHIRINGLENNEFLRTKLVHMYTSCGSFEDAQQVFDRCTCTSVYPWNALLRGTVIWGSKRYHYALLAFSEMRALGVELNEYTFSNVVKSFAGASVVEEGFKTHALLIKNGMIGSSKLVTSLIDMYFKCSKISHARKLFEEMPERDIVVWGAMIAGLAHNGHQCEALDYVRQMVSEGISPNSVILTTILPAIGEVWAKKLGQEVHGYILKIDNYSKQLPIRTGLIDMYCKCGDMGSGRQVFYDSLERNVISWTALMSGYISNGRLEQALRSLIWMQQEGIRPDVVTIATVIPVCIELRALKHGKEIHGYALKNLFLPNVSITTSLIKMYSNCGVLQYSVNLFNGLEKRNVIAWTAMIDSLVEHGYINEACHVFRSMQLSKSRPDSVTVARMLHGCSQTKALKLGKEIHGHILKKNYDPFPYVSAEIIKMYGKCGLIHKANSVFNAIPEKGSMLWTAIIETRGCNNLWRDAITLFYEMISDGSTPNHFTFKVVLSICDQAGFVDDACQIFKLMSQTYKFEASDECSSLVIGLLTRSGRTEEAQKFTEMSSLK
uniref:Pentatricopeptide repeat-containing family protein n=1 Tax=Rhizophora mucronata TaxID=61149 RepID=A0A2P2Q621_RHIMU